MVYWRAVLTLYFLRSRIFSGVRQKKKKEIWEMYGAAKALKEGKNNFCRFKKELKSTTFLIQIF